MPVKRSKYYNAGMLLFTRPNLTLQCRGRCTVRTFDSSYAADLAAMYALECINVQCKLKALLAWEVAGT
jgi:hypothetical protein